MSNDMRNNGRQADSLTVAVLGTGRMAGIHLAALAELRDRGLQVDGRRVSIEPAVYGRHTEKVRAIAEQYRVARTSTRLEELIDASDVDVVDNCLVNSEHFGPLMRAIDSGKHVFTEKPLTIDLGEAERLLAAARKAGVQHGVIQNMRFNPGPRKAVIGNCFASWVRRKHEEVPEFQIDGEDGSLLFSFNSLRTQKQAETPLFRFDARQVQAESLADWRTVDLELRDPFGLQLEQF